VGTKPHPPGRHPRQGALAFLSQAHLYHLGVLPTEQPHPSTRDLSVWARQDLPRAVACLRQVDLEALASLQRLAPAIDRLARRVARTLDAGGRVFLCGCGATGRLSLSLEFLWRQAHGGDDAPVRSFMAGGDVALVHALEGFEDHPAYGARHLEEMGFEDGDLLIACTEGGETPWVIGAAQRAAEISRTPPCFLFCNPEATLARHVERFRRVRDNAQIETFCLDVGPMALTGSTRMQASTVLQLAVGVALLHEGPASDWIGAMRRVVEQADFGFLPALIERESAIYEAGDHVTYRVAGYGITVLTDTTERAPTFSLVPFDQLVTTRPSHSPCYVSLEDGPDARQAWQRLLGRPPRAVEWPDVDPRTTDAYLHGFDFSRDAAARRRRQIPDRAHHEFRIAPTPRGIALELDGGGHEMPAAHLPELFRHLLLKLTLNIHSTLVMGRLGRYEGNLMTWVTPTNGKLVDRAARYVAHLLARAGGTAHGYEEIVHRLFEEMDRSAPGEPVVLRAFESLRERRAAS
jgi:N-acetylmuramic acid 6-phosphate etherase